MKWFSPAQIAAMGLPALPHTARGIQHRAKREHWKGRKRAGQGGGFEYPVSVLPREAQAEIANRGARKRNKKRAVPAEHQPAPGIAMVAAAQSMIAQAAAMLTHAAILLARATTDGDQGDMP